jgi:protein gp37
MIERSDFFLNRTIWLGVSVENQKAADERIPLLLQTPAAVRYLSCEPLLGPVNLERYTWPLHWHWDSKYKTPEAAIASGAYAERKPQGLLSADTPLISWVIVGGESGHAARPTTAVQVGKETTWRVGKKKAGRLLDEREWNEFPSI